jgi:hypothetical protein
MAQRRTMPTSNEQVPNTALSGDELREVIRLEVDKLLANFGILSPQMAFKRVAYSVTISLHLDNAFAPDHDIRSSSRRIATNIVSKRPDLAAIESAPLAAPSPDAVVISETLDARVSSPNSERVRLGIPVPVVTLQADGTKQVERIKYPPDPTLAADVTVRDSSAEARAAWGQPEPPADADAAALAAAAVPVYEADPLDDGDNAGQEPPR